MRSLSEPCLLWFTKGQGRITISGVTRGYTAHNAIFIPAGVMHGFEAGPAGLRHRGVLWPRLRRVLPKVPLHLRIREVHAQQELNVLLDSIGREMESDTPAHDRATRHYLGLLGVWLERQAKKAEARSPSPMRPGGWWRAIPHCWSGLPLRHGGGRVCRRPGGDADASDALLQRGLRAPGQRPVAGPPDLRGAQASGRNPIAGRPDRGQLGFNSPAYFTRAFQHLTGKSPTAFRRSA
jgi:AraC family transcriptional activator of pobA